MRASSARPCPRRPHHPSPAPYVYGPRNGEDRERFLWARMLGDKPVFIPREGEARLQFCSSRQVAEVVRASCSGRVPPGTYNVGEPRSYSILEYLDVLSDIAGARSRVVHVTERDVPAREYFPFRDIDMVLATDRLRAKGYDAQEGLADGLRETFDWCVRHGAIIDNPTPREELWRRAC